MVTSAAAAMMMMVLRGRCCCADMSSSPLAVGRHFVAERAGCVTLAQPAHGANGPLQLSRLKCRSDACGASRGDAMHGGALVGAADRVHRFVDRPPQRADLGCSFRPLVIFGGA